VKNLSSRWAVAALLAPVLVVVGLAFMDGARTAVAAGVPKTKGFIAIGFIAPNSGATNVAGFQSLLANVVAVRLNPSTDLTLSDFAAGWVSVGVPARTGIGFGVQTITTGTNFGGAFGTNGTTVSIGEARPEIQIDLSAIQNQAQIFNTAAVAAQTYGQAELVLDTGTPANIVPLCGGGSPSTEGCIVYKSKLDSSITASQIRVQLIDPATQKAAFDVAKQQITPLVLTLALANITAPATSTGTFTVLPQITWVRNNVTPSPPATNPALGVLEGTIKTNASGGFSTNRAETITAELTGTNTAVESLTLPTTCNGKTTCPFVMELPALPSGTVYDVFASGKATSYAVRSGLTVFPAGITPVVNTDLNTNPLSITTKATTSLTGKVTDTCTGTAVQTATLALLEPDAFNSGTTADCETNPPTRCVAVASAATDEVGTFPLPGNGVTHAQFGQIPIDPAANFEMVTTAAGFDRTFTQVTTSGGILKCPSTTKKGTCNFSLNHGILTGNVALNASTALQTSVLVMAEDSGTSNLESTTLVTIPGGATSAPYKMNVPDKANPGPGGPGSPITALDLFASAQDLFNGAPQKASGHTIAVSSALGAPGSCATAAQDLNGITCVGHGSASGNVTNVTDFTTVVLSKAGVDLESVPAIGPGGLNAGLYSLCAPADPTPYTFTHFEKGATTGFSTSAALSPPVTVPQGTSTPCPSICDAGQGGNCLVCTGTTVNVP
jgi:hypothetical protein